MSEKTSFSNKHKKISYESCYIIFATFSQRLNNINIL